MAPPKSLYVHVPFCPYKCPYCDFVTRVGSDKLVESYVDAVCEEIRRLDYEPRSRLDTVFFGGGTPSMLAPEQIQRILREANDCFGFDAGVEISLEANPDAVDASKLDGFRTAGVNRLSLGVQSLQPHELRLLGRQHTPAQVGQAVAWARSAGFDNLSIDLIYGTQAQTKDSWHRTLDHVCRLEPDHLSMYSLIVEPGTTYGRLQTHSRLALPEDDLVADMYDLACEIMDASGFVHYEVANWRRPGKECRHNLAYWHNEQFLAAGVGAHDFIRPFRSARIRGVQRYIAAISSHSSVIKQREYISPIEERFETVIMGLRLLEEGVPRQIYRERFEEELEDRYGAQINELRTIGFIEDDGSRIRLPESKVPLANEVWEKFLPEQ